MLEGHLLVFGDGVVLQPWIAARTARATAPRTHVELYNLDTHPDVIEELVCRLRRHGVVGPPRAAAFRLCADGRDEYLGDNLAAVLGERPLSGQT